MHDYKNTPRFSFQFLSQNQTCGIYHLCEMIVQTTVLPFKPQKHNLAF